MPGKYNDSVISFKTDSEPEDESEIAALEDFTQSHVDVDFSDDEGSTSTAPHISWRRPSQSFIRNQARELKISSACRICDQPGRPEELIFCSGCGTPWRPAHNKCLAKHRAHVPRRVRRRSSLGDEECDEVDYIDYVFTRYLLRPPSPTSRPELHANDVTCSWIGVPVFQSVDRPQIHIWSRLHDLLQMSRTARKRQYPNLISFIGDTGSGKSTLIRTMIKMARPETPQDESVPVPGLPEDRFVSTSSDIHAYADPLTLSSRSPMVYVDSEGFVGSDRPVSQEIVTALSEPGWLLQCKFGTNAAEHRVQIFYQEQQDRLLKKVNQFLDGAENRINVDWGRLDYPDPRSSVVPRTSNGRRLCRVQHNTRKLIVSHLYPRVLYGFSDVVCFVTTNGRSSNTFLGELIDWAQESHDRILNQRMKPSLIIIINKDVETGLYSSSSTDPTEQLLRSFENTERFESLQYLWEDREHPIKSTADLLRCYYSDFKVVLIPALTRKSSPAEAISVSKSIKELYETIRTSVAKVRNAKIHNGTESDLATLNTHLSRSLSVLGQDLRAALDLHDIVKEDSPIPTELSDHMAATLQQMCTARGLDNTDEIGGEQQLVDSFTPYVGACISAQTSCIEDNEVRRTTRDKLITEAQRGLQKFRWRHWRCEALDPHGRRRCQNYCNGHEKGHQFKSDSTNRTINSIRDKSSDRCSWHPDKFARRLREEIARSQRGGQAIKRLTSLARVIRLTELQSQRTCFTCLSNCPTNMLPCQRFQHGICQTCLERFARQTNGGSILVIGKCPLGCALKTGTWSIRIKPKAAGPRVLSLDGGGVRGIVELYVLSQIEQQVGYGISIHELFDLVVGTSTGGIVALGVFHERWSTRDAITRFQALAKQAFTLRLGLGNSFIKTMVQPFYTFRYTSDGIENALKQSFGRSRFLFGPSMDLKTNFRATTGGKDWVKVGVVSCLQGRAQPTLIANYSRNPSRDKDDEDYLSREDEQSRDFKIWEAARATSAAPVFFQPFVHSKTQRSYVDGALAYNNPVSLAYSEVEKIWPDSLPPDIVLSIGTGVVVEPKSGKMKTKRDSKVESLKKLLPGGYRKQIEAGLGIIQSSMSCHEAWREFKRLSIPEPRLRDNCHRLNVGLRQRVEMDDVRKMEMPLEDCEKYLCYDTETMYYNRGYRTAFQHVQTVSKRLLASLFYYVGPLQDTMKGGKYEGNIFCRLEPGSASARNLLRERIRFRLGQLPENSVNPVYSRMQHHHDSAGFKPRDLSAHVVFKAADGTFERYIEVNMPQWEEIWEPISGF